MFLVFSCSCCGPIHWIHVLSREWRCSWSSADRRCSNYIWVINNFIAYSGAPYIRDFTVCFHDNAGNMDCFKNSMYYPKKQSLKFIYNVWWNFLLWCPFIIWMCSFVYKTLYVNTWTNTAYMLTIVDYVFVLIFTWIASWNGETVLNPLGAVAGVFLENWVNTMAADALLLVSPGRQQPWY